MSKDLLFVVELNYIELFCINAHQDWEKMDIQRSIVGICDPYGNITGTGFVVSQSLILTCAHLFDHSAETAYQSVKILQNDGQVLNTRIVDEWFDVKMDVAVLRCSTISSVPPLRMKSSQRSVGHDFYSYGYAEVTGVQGITAEGKILGMSQKGNLLQLRSHEIDHGMSGAPVVDTELDVVIGMISKGKESLDKKQHIRNIFTTFAIPSDVIFKICSEITENSRSNTYLLDHAIAVGEKALALVDLDKEVIFPPDCDQAWEMVKSMWDDCLHPYFDLISMNHGLNDVAGQKIRDADFLFLNVREIMGELEKLRKVCLERNSSTRSQQAKVHDLIEDFLKKIRDQ